MNWLNSHRRLLGIIAAIVLVVGVGVFALTRGYLMHFVLNDTVISRDEFYRLTDEGVEGITSMYCTSDWGLGFMYIYEIHCFDTAEALDAYMAPESGSS